MLNRKGFTLIELMIKWMIVVVIIGILVAISVPRFISMQNRSNTLVMSDNIDDSVQKYVMVHGELPLISELMGAGGKLQNAYSGEFSEPRYAYEYPPVNPVVGGIYYYLKNDGYAIIAYDDDIRSPRRIYNWLK